MRSPTERHGRDASMRRRGRTSGSSRVDEILEALGDVLREAQARGIELSASFLHFDRRNQGLVGVDDLMAALVELQIVKSASIWSEEDAELCVYEISARRSRVYFSKEDFVVYFSSKQTNHEDMYEKDAQEKMLKKRSVMKKKPERVKNDSRLAKSAFSLSNNDSTDDDLFMASSDAALKRSLKRPLGSMLPTWAHARSKRALKELEKLSKRHPRPVSRGDLKSMGSSVPPLEFSLPQAESQDDIETDSCNERVSVRIIDTGHDPSNESDASVQFPTDQSWSLYDIDEHTTVSYRILSYSPFRDEVSPPSATARNVPEKPSECHGTSPLTPFRFTVFLDAFQRIETLDAFFHPLLTHFPRGKVLLCGFPTSMRRGTVLSSDYLAALYAKLLVHLMNTTREWLTQPKLGIGAVPQYILAFGSGARVALQLLASEIPLHAVVHASLLRFVQAQRGLVLFNGIISVEDTGTRNMWTSWQQLLTMSDSSVEWHEALLKTLFSESYLAQVGCNRLHVLEQFFKFRTTFLNGKSLDLMKALASGLIKTRGAVGDISSTLHALEATPFGILMIHSTADKLSPATQVQFLQKQIAREAESISDCLSIVRREATLFVAWLKSGHEIIQERGAYINEILRQLIFAPVDIENTESHIHSTTGHDPSCSIECNSAQVNVLSETSAATSSADQEMAEDLSIENDGSDIISIPLVTMTQSQVSARVQKLMDEKGLKWIQQELYDRGLEGSGKVETILSQYEIVLLAEAKQLTEAKKRAMEKQRKFEHIQAEKHSKQVEDLECVLREQENEQRMRRKEYDDQKAFFEQMEIQKANYAAWLEEHRQIELEDALSMKFNEQMYQEEERDGRNKRMEKKVASLEQEREEEERQRHQVELQRQRLEIQHEKRENLKKFQKEFEQNQFVCSAVEDYHLDLKPDYANFTAIVEGTLILSTDLTRFYELKVMQMNESAEKRQALHQLSKEIGEKEVTLRNLGRVLLKAKNTGMIAKAGLGTVRIVPITQAEVHSLVRELDEKRDEMARLLNEQSSLIAQLAWQDKMLQRLSVLIKRNEGFRDEILKKLDECSDIGNEMVLCVREDIEKLAEKRENSMAIAQRIQIRLQQVNDEQRRAESVDTQYFDTTLRIEGTTQRVFRNILLKELAVEKEELGKKLIGLSIEETHTRNHLSERKTTLEKYGNTVYRIEEVKKMLHAVTPPRAQLAYHAKRGTATRDDALPDEPESGSMSERVRHKKHADRTPDEKKWTALDFELNFAYYYKHVDAHEVEIIQKHPDYQSKKLKNHEIERLLTLPERNCLALAFIRSQDELEAHTLLRKYTFGDGDEYFAKLDKDHQGANMSLARADVVHTLEELVNALDKFDNPVLRSRAALLLESDAEQRSNISILSASQQQVPPHKSVTHSFHLPTGARGVLSLTVSIVFQGHFRSTGYQNGRLAAMLYVLPHEAANLHTRPIPIGKCSSATDIALCTPHSLGKIVIRHDPLAKPVDPDATFQVVLGAPVLTSYSIEVSAHTATYPADVLRKKKLDALKKQEHLPLKKDEIQNVFTTIQLSERKKRLARKLANEAKDSARQAELDMLLQTKLLEADNANPTLPQEERKALHTKIEGAEAYFTQQCFLFSQREEEVRDIESALKELTKIHADLLDQVDRMEADLVVYREHLPALAAVLVESKNSGDRDAAGARVAKELNVEYVSRYGTRSGKVFWAELSAMKAKLPSMMTPAERLRRKYKKGLEVLEKKEREWVILDRILHPRLYDWEARLVVTGDTRMRLHGTHPKLTKDEEQLAVLSQMEVERIMKAPWNLLERKEIQVRKIVTRFRDDSSDGKKASSRQASKTPTTMVNMLRAQKVSDLTLEEREWRQYDQLLNPIYYPITLKNIAEELASFQNQQIPNPVAIPPHITREDLIMALNTPEDELYKLPSELLRGRNLLMKFDPQLSINLMEAARRQHAQENIMTEKVEVDIDARCRLVYAELQRAIANTRNEFMDSAVLHTTLQRFPTKVLRLELEKELDRLLISQISEKEKYELKHFLGKGEGKMEKKELGQRAKLEQNYSKRVNKDEESISESDSDEEAKIARQEHERRIAKELAKKEGHRVRGKAMKMKSIQKQRRDIKDALQGRSLEEQRTLRQEQELGVGGCMACRSNPCLWKPYLQESFTTLEGRIEALHEELERVKRAPDLVITSSVCLAAVKSGNRAVTMRKVDLFDEITLELKLWNRHIRLRAVDKEFHDTFTCKDQYFETQALHGFWQIQLKDKVQKALHREHNRLVSNLTAYEVVEDILEFMLEGWVFGERKSERQVMGFVPSLKREGPLTMHDLRRLEEEKRILDAQSALKDEDNLQGIPLEKWKPIEVSAFEINEENKAVKKGSDLDKQLNETENALKFGIFSMTLMYFRGLSLLKKQKTVWSTSALKSSSSGSHVKTAERKRMEIQARNIAAREKKVKLYDDKARIGQERKQKLDEQRTAAYRRRMMLENQKAKREAQAAVHIQRIFRGYMGRRAGKKWMLRRREIDAQRALDKVAAITLQRAYRGRLGRIKAEERRIELAEFISQIRAEEAIEEEEEYWKKHRIERIARQVAAYVKKQS